MITINGKEYRNLQEQVQKNNARIPEIEKTCDKIFLYHSKDDFCVSFSQ